MAISNIKAVFCCDIKKVWDVVTSLENYSWRSDLSKITVLNDKQFVERTTDGYETKFNITCSDKYKRYEFDMENDTMKGHWVGIFSYQNGKTTIDFTENVTAKKIFMKPFVKTYLKKQQSTYVNDLQKTLGESNTTLLKH